MKKNKTRERNKVAFLSFCLIAIGIILVVYAFFNFPKIATSNEISYGVFGDFIGGIVGSVWALAGVLLFYAALHEQRKEFKLQSKEFELQRQELQETRKIFELQSKTLKTQQFEETFFSLLTLYQNVANAIKDLQKINIKKGT